MHDENQLAATKAAAIELTDKAVSELGEAKPASITVTAVSGHAADELQADARGGAVAGGLAAHSQVGSVSSKVLHRAKCQWW